MEKQFEKAGLFLKVLDKPITKTSVDIFQMDIREGRGAGHDTFRIYRGPAKINIVNASKDDRQLVLSVVEPPQKFTRTIWSMKGPEEVTEKTPGSRRHYLVGYDETGRHGFIAQLPQHASTVRDAKDLLKGDGVDAGKKRGKVIRQGEWFFIPPTNLELEELKKAIQRNEAAIERKAPIGGARHRAHVAAELVNFGGKIFVRGNIRHVDHFTTKLKEWHIVSRNSEVQGGNSSIRWID